MSHTAESELKKIKISDRAQWDQIVRQCFQIVGDIPRVLPNEAIAIALVEIALRKLCNVD